MSRDGLGFKVLLCQDTGEGVGGVGSRHGEGGEEDGATCRLHWIDGERLNTYRE